MEAGVFNHPLAKELVERTRVLWALGHAMGLMSWDLETYMPRRGVEGRSVAFAELAVLRRRLLLDEKLGSLVEKAADRLEELNDYERGLVRVLSREIRIARAVPEELTARLAKVTSQATRVWAEAKKNNNYEAFKPWLGEIVELVREKAEKLGYREHPYDALVDLYEEGWTTRDVEEMFERLVPGIRRILERVLEEGFYPQRHPLEERGYEKEAAVRANRALLDVLGWPWDRGRLDESPHPFTIGLDVGDVRITTRYEGRDVKRTLYAVMHEFGHALYDMQVDERLARTLLGSGASLGVHEGQSRFWENIVGRSPWFMPLLKKVLSPHLPWAGEVELLELYRYVNTVRPDTIRVEADELTYNLHIYLRFRLEKLLVAGELGVEELLEEWDRLMEELLGVRPKNYSEGVLQDIHWSHGSIGYFPTYTLGNIIAAQAWKALRSEDPGALEEPRLDAVKRWQRERIHRWGKTYPPKQLIEKAFGSKPSPEPLLEYLEWKYTVLPGRIEEVLPREQ